MKVNVDREVCIGCGMCASTAPDVFELDDENIATVVGEITDKNHNSTVEAVENCPVDAISRM